MSSSVLAGARAAGGAVQGAFAAGQGVGGSLAPGRGRREDLVPRGGALSSGLVGGSGDPWLGGRPREEEEEVGAREGRVLLCPPRGFYAAGVVMLFLLQE